MSALGQKPSFYRKPAQGLVPANSRPSSEKMDKQLDELPEWQEFEKQTLVIDLK